VEELCRRLCALAQVGLACVVPQDRPPHRQMITLPSKCRCHFRNTGGASEAAGADREGEAEESDANELLGPVLDHATTPARPNQQVMIHESAGGGSGGAAEVVAEEAAASNGNPSAGAGEAEDGGRRPAEDGGRHDHVRRQNTGFDAVTL
jgi:hypothetical protein